MTANSEAGGTRLWRDFSLWTLGDLFHVQLSPL